MLRKLVLAMTILALAAVPVPAWARDDGHDGRHEVRENHERFRGHERFERGPSLGFGFYPSPYYYAYAPPACAWQPGYWVTQPYVDAWGRYTYAQQWVPRQWVCP